MTDHIRDIAEKIPLTRHAVLPEHWTAYANAISNMDIGDEGWTTPDAMFHDGANALWLDGVCSIYRYRDDDKRITMQVSRNEEGFHVDATHCRNAVWGPAMMSLLTSICKVCTFKEPQS